MKGIFLAAALTTAAALVVPALAESAGQTAPARGREVNHAGGIPMANAGGAGAMMEHTMAMMRMMNMMAGSSQMAGRMPAGAMMGGAMPAMSGPETQPHSRDK